MKNIRSYTILGLGIFVTLVGIYALFDWLTNDGNPGGAGALVLGVAVIGFWQSGWFK